MLLVGGVNLQVCSGSVEDPEEWAGAATKLALRVSVGSDLGNQAPDGGCPAYRRARFPLAGCFFVGAQGQDLQYVDRGETPATYGSEHPVLQPNPQWQWDGAQSIHMRLPASTGSGGPGF